jgi:hypothetical protein
MARRASLANFGEGGTHEPRADQQIMSHPGFDAVPISGPPGLERGDCSDGKTTEVLRGAAASSRR